MGTARTISSKAAYLKTAHGGTNCSIQNSF